mmetsp:Transcript_612/g.2236  ORF Transcript_612/g.2236 Transcript_612/m.2236 type:complete len:90 (-) Transcript_612:760-1029(-)
MLRFVVENELKVDGRLVGGMPGRQIVCQSTNENELLRRTLEPDRRAIAINVIPGCCILRILHRIRWQASSVMEQGIFPKELRSQGLNIH